MSEKPDYADSVEFQLIADYVSEGTTFIDACRTLGLNRTTIWSRIDQSPRAIEAMEKARQDGYDILANECLDIADDTSLDTTYGKHGAKPNKEWIARSRLRVDTRLKLLAKWHPKKYGEKLQIESKTASHVIPVSDDPIEAQKAYEEFLRS